jgi:hypothetical protein
MILARKVDDGIGGVQAFQRRVSRQRLRAMAGLVDLGHHTFSKKSG